MVMRSIAWTDELSVGNDDLDADHKTLVDILNELFTAVFAGVGESMLDPVIARLRSYTQGHFSREEAALRSVGYPALESHCQQHRQLIRQLEEFTDKVRSGGQGDTDMDMVLFLRSWLFDHILGHDKLYAPYLKGAGGPSNRPAGQP